MRSFLPSPIRSILSGLISKCRKPRLWNASNTSSTPKILRTWTARDLSASFCFSSSLSRLLPPENPSTEYNVLCSEKVLILVSIFSGYSSNSFKWTSFPRLKLSLCSSIMNPASSVQHISPLASRKIRPFG